MSDEEIEDYGETGIQSGNAPIPRWLIMVILILPFWGLVWFALFWNGSYGWLDRGHWHELQRAANTTFPEIQRSHD